MKQKISENRSVRSISRKQNAYRCLDYSPLQHSQKRVKTQSSFRNILNVRTDNSFIVTKRAKMYKKESRDRTSDLHDDSTISKEEISNFQILKRQAKCLDSQATFLGKSNIETDENISYIRNKQFSSSKKVSAIEKFRQNIKKLNKKNNKQLSFLNIKGLSQIDFRPSLTVKNELLANSNPILKKKKQTPSIVKKYYKPVSLRTCNSNLMVTCENQQNLSLIKRKKSQNIDVCSNTTSSYKRQGLFIVCL